MLDTIPVAVVALGATGAAGHARCCVCARKNERVWFLICLYFLLSVALIHAHTSNEVAIKRTAHFAKVRC